MEIWPLKYTVKYIIVKLICKDILKWFCSPVCQIKRNLIIGLSSWLLPSRWLTCPHCTAVHLLLFSPVLPGLDIYFTQFTLTQLEYLPASFRFFLSIYSLFFDGLDLPRPLSDSPPITHKPCSDKCYLSIIRLVQFIKFQMKYDIP